MTIYIDNEYRCFAEPKEGLRHVETDAFVGKCKEFIEGYRFIPSGESWVREDGTIFRGKMVSPWKDSEYLNKIQFAFEEGQKNILSEVEEVLGI